MSISKSDKEIIPPEEESFIGRWSRRKHAAQEGQAELQHNDMPTADVKNTLLLTDADMPPIETLNEDSDYTGFLSPKVSESLRKVALRKLFGSSGFNIRDGLDDYDGDYTYFEKLGDIITADMRHQMEMESRRRLEQLAEQETTENDEQVDVAAVSEELNETPAEEQVLDDNGTKQTVEQVDDAEVEL
jgi:hypothetical protein